MGVQGWGVGAEGRWAELALESPAAHGAMQVWGARVSRGARGGSAVVNLGFGTNHG